MPAPCRVPELPPLTSLPSRAGPLCGGRSFQAPRQRAGQQEQLAGRGGHLQSGARRSTPKQPPGDSTQTPTRCSQVVALKKIPGHGSAKPHRMCVTPDAPVCAPRAHGAKPTEAAAEDEKLCFYGFPFTRPHSRMTEHNKRTPPMPPRVSRAQTPRTLVLLCTDTQPRLCTARCLILCGKWTALRCACS